MRWRLVVTVVVLLAAAMATSTAAHAEYFDEYGLESVDVSLSTTQAGAHPDFTTSFELKTDESGAAFGQLYKLAVSLPPGLIGNLANFPQCTTLELGFAYTTSHCPQDSQLGVTEISLEGLGTFTEPLYNMVASGDGKTVARLGFIAGIYPFLVNAQVRSEDDYGVTATVEGPPSVFPVRAGTTTLWGVPADPSHDTLRITPVEAHDGVSPPGGGRASGQPPAPFMTNPTSCGEPLEVVTSVASYQRPEQLSTLKAPLPQISGCGKLDFAPRFAADPTTHEAGAPSGLEAELEVPQDETPQGFATSHLRSARVIFPEGMTIAAGAADGQLACSAEEAGYRSRERARCPGAAKLGTVEVDVPVLEDRLQGALYLRTPEPGDLFRVWLIVDDLGIHLALPGELDVDKATGQITAAFVDMPQAPVREAQFHVFGGSRGPLATPSACGRYETDWQFLPWSGGAAASGGAAMTIDQGCAGGGFSPDLSAGSTNPVAGAFSSFVTTLTRASNEQNIAGLSVSLPPGVVAKIAGVALCSDAAAPSGNCPVGSRVGRATVATGPGPAPLWLPQPGKDPILAYLAGPYRGAPYSLVVKTPAQAGPFDLGTVVVRAAIRVDPETAAVTVESDPLPQIIEGVPVSYRTIHAEVDRSRFALNPTSCDPAEVRAKVTSAQGAVARPASRFQVGGCRELPFKPRLRLQLTGSTNRGAHPALRATLTTAGGDANLARAQVALPHSEFLDQAHIRTICTRVQFAADQCPRGSIYGHARAISPLLDEPLEGPVFLRSSRNPLPDLVIALRGSIDIDAVGRIDSIDGGIRTTFAAIPDAPVSKVVLSMQGGHKGLLVNSTELCTGVHRATAKLTGHNGKRRNPHPLLKVNCGESK